MSKHKKKYGRKRTFYARKRNAEQTPVIRNEFTLLLKWEQNYAKKGINMTRAEFKQGLANALQVDTAWLKEDMLLSEIEGWDSLGLVSAIALFGDVGVKVDVSQIRAAKTIFDIIALAGDALQG